MFDSKIFLLFFFVLLKIAYVRKEKDPNDGMLLLNVIMNLSCVKNILLTEFTEKNKTTCLVI